ncbi:MAG: DUF2063 domain-containing protein [Qingshengfaniella sp.]
MGPSEVERRFAVYRNNVTVSLIDALARRFPVVQRLVGDDFFREMARLYIAEHRPRSPVLLEWGAGFPIFLAWFAPLKTYPYMADVARIEMARGVAYHAADATPISPDRFLRTDAARLIVTLHPSVQVLRLRHAAVTIWNRNQPGAAKCPFQASCPEFALVLRDPFFNIQVMAISEGDAVMIETLRARATLTAAAEAAQWVDADHDAKATLLRFVQSGAIIDLKETQ